jgi:TolB protein
MQQPEGPSTLSDESAVRREDEGVPPPGYGPRRWPAFLRGNAGAGLLAAAVVILAVVIVGNRRGASSVPTASSGVRETPAPDSRETLAQGTPPTAGDSGESESNLSFDDLAPLLRSGGPGLFVVRARDSAAPVPEDLGEGNSPAWSPDGQKLAFIRKDDAGLSQLFVYDTEAGTTRQITRTLGAKGHPSWDAEGTRIAYSTHENGHYEVYFIRPDGSDPENFTKSGPDVNDLAPVWSPDGQQIAYRSDRDGNNEVYVQRSRVESQ